MFLRATTRKKDGKEHRYFCIVENKRVSGARVVQRHVLYLGEINSSQELAWRLSIEVLDEATRVPRTLALLPEDRCEALVATRRWCGSGWHSCGWSGRSGVRAGSH
jgi:hypothetical protein